MQRFNKATVTFAITALFGIGKAFFPEYGTMLDGLVPLIATVAVYAVPNKS